MCGISIVVTNRGAEYARECVRRMSDSIRHRGPDDEGYYVAACRAQPYTVAMGHRRLSIIDVGSGRQPLFNEDETVAIVFNGEIYNYRELREELVRAGHSFRTESDTEVIVHAYEEFGDDVVNRLRGMFAFAIWDDNKQTLILARDRFGKKPLFISETSDGFNVCSEMKGCRIAGGDSPKLDEGAVWNFLLYRYVPGPATLLEGIRKLQPGTIATWRHGGWAFRKYYDPADGSPAQRVSRAATKRDPRGQFLELLEESINLRMISDVPFGAFLSGGIDSSAIVALMSKNSRLPVQTFSVGFAEKRFSELNHARLVARHFKTQHHELVIGSKDIIDNLDFLVGYRDAPLSEPADVPIFLLAMESARHVKMVLSGEGSDEILGGYGKHLAESHLGWFARLPYSLRRTMTGAAKAFIPRFSRGAISALDAYSQRDWSARMPRWFGAASEAGLIGLLNPDWVARNKRTSLVAEPNHGNSALRKILYFDQVSWLPDNLLERADRMTMAASIEARMPFMDHHLVEFVAGLDDSWRICGTVTKRILKQSMRGIVPDEIIRRKKIGFSMPLREWLRGTMRDYLLSRLLSGSGLLSQIARKAELERMVREHVEGTRDHEKLLWCLLNLETWYVVTFGGKYN